MLTYAEDRFSLAVFSPPTAPSSLTPLSLEASESHTPAPQGSQQQYPGHGGGGGGGGGTFFVLPGVAPLNLAPDGYVRQRGFGGGGGGGHAPVGVGGVAEEESRLLEIALALSLSEK